MPAILLPRLERKQAVRPLTHPVTVAFGLANLYLLDLTGPLIATDHDLVSHLIGSASSVIIPIIVYIVVLSLLLTALLYLAERPVPLRVIIWSAFLLALPSPTSPARKFPTGSPISSPASAWRHSS